MRLRGHRLILDRTKLRGRTTSWWAKCECGWTDPLGRVGSRLSAKGRYEEHKLSAYGMVRGLIERAYSDPPEGV